MCFFPIDPHRKLVLMKKEIMPIEEEDVACGHATKERVAPFIAPLWALFPPVDDLGDGAGNMQVHMVSVEGLKIPTLVNKRIVQAGDVLVWAEKGEPHKPLDSRATLAERGDLVGKGRTGAKKDGGSNNSEWPRPRGPFVRTKAEGSKKLQ